MAPSPGDVEFSLLKQQANDLLDHVKKSKSVNISSEAIRDGCREMVQRWFRGVRPSLRALEIVDEIVTPVDREMQTLLRLANGRNRKTSYVTALEAVRSLAANLDVPREMAIGQSIVFAPADQLALSRTEVAILRTLAELVPSAALAYEQALKDLADDIRISFRGPANELRSVVWDVLDRLAPDADVMTAPGFKLETGLDKPTHKQKARFILRSRLGGSARQAPEATLDLIEERVGALGRAIYSRSSVSAHVATARGEVEQVKMYVDSFLTELLEVHHR